MLTKADKQFLKENFASKDYLDSALKPIKKSLREMNRKLATTIKFFDTSTINHKKRIERVEKHLGLPPFAD